MSVWLNPLGSQRSHRKNLCDDCDRREYYVRGIIGLEFLIIIVVIPVRWFAQNRNARNLDPTKLCVSGIMGNAASTIIVIDYAFPQMGFCDHRRGIIPLVGLYKLYYQFMPYLSWYITVGAKDCISKILSVSSSSRITITMDSTTLVIMVLNTEHNSYPRTQRV